MYSSISSTHSASTPSSYPFGMEMPGRSFTSESYRFGFNGKEKEGEEWTGTSGNHLDFGARIYDSRLGKWLSTDPQEAMYSFVSPFTFALNTPMQAIDPDGETVYFVIFDGENSEHNDAALSRVREIENSKSFNNLNDKVYYINLSNENDLLKNIIADRVKDPEANGFGKTEELSFFGHGAVDGPVMDLVHTGDDDLSKLTNNSADRGQLSPKGWGSIDFNWDEDVSFAAFYGCVTEGFAARFVIYNDVKYAAGLSGRAGVSESNEKYNANWFTNGNESLWLWDGNPVPIFTESRPGEDGAMAEFYYIAASTGPTPYKEAVGYSKEIGKVSPNVTKSKIISQDANNGKLQGPLMEDGTF